MQRQPFCWELSHPLPGFWSCLTLHLDPPMSSKLNRLFASGSISYPCCWVPAEEWMRHLSETSCRYRPVRENSLRRLTIICVDQKRVPLSKMVVLQSKLSPLLAAHNLQGRCYIVRALGLDKTPKKIPVLHHSIDCPSRSRSMLRLLEAEASRSLLPNSSSQTTFSACSPLKAVQRLWPPLWLRT